MMDKGTIGSKKCEISLNNILIGLEKRLGKDAKNTIRRVTYLYHSFRNGLKHLQKLDDINFYNSMALLLKNDIINKLEVNKEKYEETLGKDATALLSHFRCCVVASFREARRKKIMKTYESQIIRKQDATYVPCPLCGRLANVNTFTSSIGGNVKFTCGKCNKEIELS